MEFITKEVDITTVINEIWIGLEKNSISGFYEWTDGSSLTFTSFIQPQTQPCVYMKNNAWYGSDCFTLRSVYVCKTPRSKIRILV